MNLLELRTRLRESLDDYDGIQRFTDARCNRAINEAQVEACRRSDLITDTIEITLVADTEDYDVSEIVTRIRRVTYKNQVLQPRQKNELDSFAGDRTDWQKEGVPQYYIYDPLAQVIIIDRYLHTVDSSDKLILTVNRLPDATLTNNTDTPQIKSHWHESMLNWSAYLLLRDSDPDTQDPVKADRYAQAFTSVFGEQMTVQSFYQRSGSQDRSRAVARFL